MSAPHPFERQTLTARLLESRQFSRSAENIVQHDIGSRKRYAVEELHSGKTRRTNDGRRQHETNDDPDEDDDSTVQDTERVGAEFFEPKEPCMFSEDEAEEGMHRQLDDQDAELDSDEDEECPFCVDNSAYGISDEICTNRANILSHATGKYGTVRDDILYDSILHDHRKYVEKPLSEQGLRTPKLTHKKIRNHFNPREGKLHVINLKHLTGESLKNIHLLENKLFRNAVCVRDTASGKKSIDKDRQKELESVMKLKLDYMKFFKSFEDASAGGASMRGAGTGRARRSGDTSVRHLASSIQTPLNFLNNY